MKKNLSKCPRCGGIHEDLQVKELSTSIKDPFPLYPERPCTYHLWAQCPTLNEPILIRRPDKEDIYLPIKPNPEHVQELAYEIWEERGRPTGLDEENWLLAEQALTRYYVIASEWKFKIEHREHILDTVKINIEQMRAKSMEQMEKEIWEKWLAPLPATEESIQEQ